MADPSWAHGYSAMTQKVLTVNVTRVTCDMKQIQQFVWLGSTKINVSVEGGGGGGFLPQKIFETWMPYNAI